MGLQTKGSGLVAGQEAGRDQVKVMFLKGTYVASVGRDVEAKESIIISAEDARFLIAYKYCVAVVKEANTAEVAK